MGGWILEENIATLWLHLASWTLPDSQLSVESKLEPSVAILYVSTCTCVRQCVLHISRVTHAHLITSLSVGVETTTRAGVVTILSETVGTSIFTSRDSLAGHTVTPLVSSL